MERGPLILGSGGRVGRLLRALAARGRWPGPPPLFHARRPDGAGATWDLQGPPPPDLDLSGVRGVVCLAGATAGDGLVAGNVDPALAALDLALDRGLGPVLLMSSAAVYGRDPGPCAEDRQPRPATPYGEAKLLMEQAVALAGGFVPPGRACCLRVGNVVGADALSGAMARGPVTLDRLAGGSAPRRACVGPLSLARALVRLLGRADLPPVLNLAQPGLVGMDELLAAVGHPFAWREAPPSALPVLALDLGRMTRLAPLPTATAAGLVAEARLAGWRAGGAAGGEAA